MKCECTATEQIWQPDQYQLIDFGGGRKLERFGSTVLDRPCPASLAARKTPAVDWSISQFALDAGATWCKSSADDLRVVSRASTTRDDLRPQQAAWQVSFGEIVFNLKLTPFGHVGLFPEQSSSWNWLRTRVAAFLQQTGRSPQVLNLFAYTGGTTLALALAGAKVVHVDASLPAVQWARRNALSSGLVDRPIRWITEDARRFVSRELRRGNGYDMVVMDPPTYGHGPTGRAWVMHQDLPDLMRESIALLEHRSPAQLLLTGHSENPSMEQIAKLIAGHSAPQAMDLGRLHLVDLQGRGLDAGFFVRVTL